MSSMWGVVGWLSIMHARVSSRNVGSKEEEMYWTNCRTYPSESTSSSEPSEYIYWNWPWIWWFPRPAAAWAWATMGWLSAYAIGDIGGTVWPSCTPPTPAKDAAASCAACAWIWLVRLLGPGAARGFWACRWLTPWRWAFCWFYIFISFTYTVGQKG